MVAGVAQVPQRACGFLASSWNTTGQRTGDRISEEGTTSSLFTFPRRKCSHRETGVHGAGEPPPGSATSLS